MVLSALADKQGASIFFRGWGLGGVVELCDTAPPSPWAGDGCGLARETWNEIERHTAGTSRSRNMLAAADYGPTTHGPPFPSCLKLLGWGAGALEGKGLQIPSPYWGSLFSTKQTIVALAASSEGGTPTTWKTFIEALFWTDRDGNLGGLEAWCEART